jgi:hypothetical protein
MHRTVKPLLNCRRLEKDTLSAYQRPQPQMLGSLLCDAIAAKREDIYAAPPIRGNSLKPARCPPSRRHSNRVSAKIRLGCRETRFYEAETSEAGRSGLSARNREISVCVRLRGEKDSNCVPTTQSLRPGPSGGFSAIQMSLNCRRTPRKDWQSAAKGAVLSEIPGA